MLARQTATDIIQTILEGGGGLVLNETASILWNKGSLSLYHVYLRS